MTGRAEGHGTEQLPVELVGYVPRVVAQRLAADPAPIATPGSEAAHGACLFVDIVGFTSLTEELSRRGTAGAEAMAALLDVWFGALIDLATAHGGDVVDFAGDALLIVWWTTSEDLPDAVARAVAAAIAMQEAVRGHEAPDASLAVRITLTAGELDVVFVGVEGHKRCLVSGAPTRTIARLSDCCEPGETILSPEAAASLPGDVRGDVAPDGSVRVVGLPETPDPVPLDPVIVPSAARSALEEFLPAALDRRFTLSRDPWLAEFRRVTSVFVRLVGLPSGPALAPRLGAVIEDIQTVVHRHEGTIHQLIDGDKGTVLLAAFGLPPGAHEDDPERGVRTALAVDEVVAGHGLRGAIGVSTGRAFFGPVGGTRRRDLSLVGDRVNLAARLMQQASDDILCDETTAAAFDRIAYDVLTPLELKGRSGAVRVLRPQGSETKLVRTRATETTLVGRGSEQSVLAGALERLEGGGGGLVVIEGEAGIGKSRLVEDLIGRVDARGMRALVGTARPVESSTALYSWRPVLAAALDLHEVSDDAGARRRHLLRWLDAGVGPDVDPSLLNDVLGVRLPPGPDAATAPEERAAATRALIGDILAVASAAERLLVVLEDAHWLDPASWALTKALVERDLPLLVVVATRPIAEPSDAGRDVWSRATVVRLGALEPADTLALVRERLGVETLPGSVRDLIVERAEGHPFFTEELIRSLREAGVLVVGDGAAHLVGGDDAIAGLAVPDTVQGVVRSRIDRLSARQQLVLKTASVVGRTFDLALVEQVFPVDDERQHVRADHLELRGRGLLSDGSGEADRGAFAHAITRDVAYDTMPWAQRRSLHRRAAEAIEAREDGTMPHVVLAHHWTHAAGPGGDDTEAIGRAVAHLGAAGAASLRQGAFVEAERFYRDALDVFQRLPEESRTVREELDLLRPLGTALYATHGFGSQEASVVHERAFALASGEVAGRELFPHLWGLWSTTHFSADTEAAVRLGERLMAIADETGDPQLQLQAHHALWTTLMTIPDYGRARRHLAAGARLYRPEWHADHCATYGGHDPGSCAHRAMALTQWSTGRVDQAVASGVEAVRLAQDHEASTMNARLALAFVHHERGDLESTESEVKALIDVARAQGIPKWIDWAEVLGAWVRGRRGDTGQAISQIETIADRIDMTDPGYLLMLVDLYLRAERTAEGLALVDRLLSVIETRGERSQEPELHRLHGELLLSRSRHGDGAAGDRDRALACFRRAFEVAESQGADSFSLRAAISATRATVGTPGQGWALGALHEVRARFTEGHATADLRAASALLA